MSQRAAMLVLKYLVLKYAATAILLAFVGNRFYDSVLKNSNNFYDGLAKAGAYGIYVLVFIVAMTALCFLLYYLAFKGIVFKVYILFVIALLSDFVIHWKLFSPSSLLPPTIGLVAGILLSLYAPYRTIVWSSS